jgi:hypothetical protein
MSVEIRTETPIFLIWEYLFRNFGIWSLQCGSSCNSKLTDQETKERDGSERWIRERGGSNRVWGFEGIILSLSLRFRRTTCSCIIELRKADCGLFHKKRFFADFLYMRIKAAPGGGGGWPAPPFACKMTRLVRAAHGRVTWPQPSSYRRFV